MKSKSYQLIDTPGDRVVLTMYKDEKRSEMPTGHCHQQMEVTLILNGSGSIKTNHEKTFDAEAGDIFVFDSMQPHQLVFVDNRTSFDTLSIVFDIRGFIKEEYNVFERSDLDRFFMKLYNAQCVIFKGSEGAKKIKEVLLRMEEEFLMGEKGSKHVIRAQMLLLYALLLQYYDEMYDSSKMHKYGQNASIEKTLIYINQHLSDEITLEKLAEVACMNKTYYSTMFKKVIGKTVWEYILHMRIELAISYLVLNKSKYNITEIAQMCGFNNAAHFNKVFKRITGTTPSAYKKSEYNSCFSK